MAKSGDRTYEITGSVLNLIPLRNRRTTPEGEQLVTRISEGMTEWHWNGRSGYGLSEYLDQIVDGARRSDRPDRRLRRVGGLHHRPDPATQDDQQLVGDRPLRLEQRAEVPFGDRPRVRSGSTATTLADRGSPSMSESSPK